MHSLRRPVNIILIFVLLIQVTNIFAGRLPKPPVPATVETTLNKPSQYQEKQHNTCSIYEPEKIVASLKKCALAYESSVGQQQQKGAGSANATAAAAAVNNNKTAVNSNKTAMAAVNGTTTMDLSVDLITHNQNGSEPSLRDHMLSLNGIGDSASLHQRIAKIPCFGACILMDLGYIYTNGTANHTLVIQQLTKAYGGLSAASGEKIIQNCYAKTGYNGTRIMATDQNVKDGGKFAFTEWDPAKCVLVSKFGICVARGASEFCKKGNS